MMIIAVVLLNVGAVLTIVGVACSLSDEFVSLALGMLVVGMFLLLIGGAVAALD